MKNIPTRKIAVAIFFLTGSLAPATAARGADEAQTLDLSRYRLEKKIEIRDEDGEEIPNCSGLTYRASPPGIFIVCDHPEQVVELAPDGAFRRRIDLDGFEDLEGIAHVSGADFLVVEEGDARLVRIKIHPETRKIRRKDCPDYRLDERGGNRNPEGLAYDPVGKRFFSIKEREPRKIYEVILPQTEEGKRRKKGDKARITHPWDLDEKDLGLDDVSGVFFDAPSGHLVLLSHESECAVECTLAGEEVSRLNFDGELDKAEGIGFTNGPPDERRLYICGEPNELCIYAPRKSTTSGWPRHVIAEGFENQTAVAADFSGDGRPDVMVSARAKTRLYVAPDWRELILTDGQPRKHAIHSEVLDVDGDGDPDYIGAVYSPGPIFWLERPEKPLTEPWPYHLVDDAVNGTHGLLVGDIDGDGKPDLAANSGLPEGKFAESLVWYKVPPEPRKAERWTRHVFADGDAPGLSHYLGLGDVNGDGRTDAASAAKIAEGGNWFAWWEQPAEGRLPWKKHVLATGQEGATNILMAHVNGDKQVDFIASRGHGKGVLWFEAPDFRLHEINSELEGPHCLAVGDIDGDGDIDATTCAKISKIAAWFENDGAGRFKTHTIHEDQAAYDIRLVDMDVDGDLDVLIAGENSKNVVWYENRVAR